MLLLHPPDYIHGFYDAVNRNNHLYLPLPYQSRHRFLNHLFRIKLSRKYVCFYIWTDILLTYWPGKPSCVSRYFPDHACTFFWQSHNILVQHKEPELMHFFLHLGSAITTFLYNPCIFLSLTFSTKVACFRQIIPQNLFPNVHYFTDSWHISRLSSKIPCIPPDLYILFCSICISNHLWNVTSLPTSVTHF